ncbi:UDPglucose 6-dehydrogenase [Paenibacillus sp. PvP094]|uniref:UDP-glucose dehydrogenase family protein n=1 Tax=Paenibacillus sp. PvP094 TaxID=3156394 RepID=UPI003392D476
MKILVIGTGYVGTTTALVFAEMGWKVVGLDTDAHKVDQLMKGELYFYEPGLKELLVKHLKTGQVMFTTNQAKAIQENDVIFICVGTPALDDGNADLTYVKRVSQDIGRYMNGYKLIVNKSTVPVGTQEKVTQWILGSQATSYPYDVASNPEFLREGKAMQDSLNPDRVIIGAKSAKAAKMLQTLYASVQCPIVVTTPRTAELIKYASNAFLATKISYINELSRLCDKLGVDIKEVAFGMGLDQRIGSSFLQAGIGYGGSCFPKDVAALLRIAKDNNTELQVLKNVVEVNETQYLYMVETARRRLGDFANKKVVVLGLAFKPDTDDIREAPAIRIIQSLTAGQAQIKLFDPVAKLPSYLKNSNIQTMATAEEGFKDADAIFICTEWKMYHDLNWSMLRKQMKQPNIFDGRNMLNADFMKSLGYYYQGVGYN